MQSREKVIIDYVNEMLQNPVSLEKMLALRIAETYYGFVPALSQEYSKSYRKRIAFLQKAILTTMAQGLLVGLTSDESREDILEVCARFHRQDMSGKPIFKETNDNGQ